jgi:hypothetical protein
LGVGGGVVGIDVAVVDPVGIGVGITGGFSGSSAPKREISQPPAVTPKMNSSSALRTDRLFHRKGPTIMVLRVRSVVTHRHE